MPTAVRNKPDAFLYSIIAEQASDAPLTVLSLLARHEIDPWDEAADYARLPRAAAIARFSALLERTIPNNLGEGCRGEAARLLDLLPRPDSIDALTQNWMWPALKGLFDRLRFVAEIWKGDHRR
jgi:hypothetical protein